MKKMIKNKQLIFGIIIGIIFSSVGVYAATVYPANQIAYKDVTVEDALNDLYTKSNCINGIYSHNQNTQWKIDLGFEPKTFFISLDLGGEKYRYFMYNSNLLDSVLYFFYNKPSAFAAEDHTSEFNISTSIITTFPTSYLMYTNEYSLYYVACK